MKLTLSIAIVALCVAGCQSKPEEVRSAALQEFVDRCKSITVEMTEEQVDNILEKYEASSENRRSEESHDGTAHRRPSVKVKTYDSKKKRKRRRLFHQRVF